MLSKRIQKKEKNNRKKELVIIAILILAFSTTIGTYAWFSKNIVLPTPPTSLNITNGQINAAGISTNGQKWTYDIVAGTTANPDITGVPMDAGSPSRAVIGGIITAAITNARPGDAFNLGTIAAPLTIKNTGNLTIKAQLSPNAGSTNLSALTAAGWKLYVNGTAWDGSGSITIASITPNNTANLAVRLEFPTSSTTAVETLSTGAIDLNNLFTLTITQENNPGWTS